MNKHFNPDHNSQQILRYRRLRAERQEVLYGDIDPLLCRRGNTLVLCGRGGSLAVSDDGVSWSQLADLATPEAPGSVVLALTIRDDKKLVAAIGRNGCVLILSADEPAGSWRVITTLDIDLDDSATVGLTALADGSLLLCLPGRVLQSADSGETWGPAAELTPGFETFHPLQLGSGRLIAPVGGTAGDISLAVSDDNGITWKVPDGFSPLSATLTNLPDGRLVLSYGMPHFPYGARAVIGSAPDDHGVTHWEDEIHVLALSRYPGIRAKARPVLAAAGVSAATVVTTDGTIVSAFHRGEALGSYAPTIYGPGMDEWGRRPAIGVVRWTPEGLDRPPLIYPNLWTDHVDSRGYLDNGMVRMRPDDRYEGGDYVENFEMTACRPVAAEHGYFAGEGAKGVVVCRHPDGSLVYSSRDHRIHRSTDEGHTWNVVSEIPLTGHEPAVFGFGVTSAGTYLLTYATTVEEADPAHGTFPGRVPRVTRSDDGGRTWTDAELGPRPMRYSGNGDGSRIVELSDGTVVAFCGNAWNDPRREAGYEGDALMRSHDDGESWGDWTVLPPGSCESNLLELRPGELMCATRYQRENNLSLDLFSAPTDQGGGRLTWPAPSANHVGPGRYKNEAIMFSADGGYNWTTPFFVTRLHMVSADAVKLADGRVVLTYDHKDAVGGCRALVSSDGGRTWEPEPYILSYHNMDARTSSVLLQDGRVLTLWAGNRDEGIHSTTWSPED